MPFRVTCEDCDHDESYDERYKAAADRDAHAEATGHDVGYAEVA